MRVRPDHVCISVASLEAASAWYAAALGFETQTVFDVPGVGRAALLRTPAGAGLELFEAESTTEGAAWQDPVASLRRRGLAHVAFAVDDVDGAVAAAIAAGGAVAGPPRDGSTPGVRLAFIHDLDGNLIELKSTGRNNL